MSKTNFTKCDKKAGKERAKFVQNKVAGGWRVEDKSLVIFKTNFTKYINTP